MRPLYKASSVVELERFCTIDPSIQASSNVEKTINTAFSEGEKCKNSDEERAYILYSRGLKLFQAYEKKRNHSVSHEVRGL